MCRACRPKVQTPPLGGGGVAVTREDVRAACRVPGRSELSLAFIDYVPSMPEMTLPLGLHPENTPCRARPVDRKWLSQGAFLGQLDGLLDTTFPVVTMLDIASLVRVHVVHVYMRMH